MLDGAVALAGYKHDAAKLTKGALLLNLDIAEKLGCLNAAGFAEMRHGKGSNFAFADGSARFVLRYKELYPENPWAVMDSDRYPPAPPQELPYWRLRVWRASQSCHSG